MSEQELIEQAKEGNRAAMSALVKNYEQTVYNFSFKICRNKDKAEHTMQETFLSMIKHLDQFSGQSKLSTWLYRVVSNHCLMLARSQNKYEYASFENEDSDIDEKNIADWKISPDNILENEELKNQLDNAIQQLPAEYRVVFLLRDVEDFSTEETANMLELSVPAVKSRLHRARAFLRNELNKMMNNGK
jgi:RNA polymerase sigma-70 factor (ECF subfamily)